MSTDVTSKSVVTVLSDYALLVKSRALKYLNNYCELEDLIQEGNLGLIKAVVIIFVISTALVFVQNEELSQIINSSIILEFVNNNNPLLNIFN